MGRDFNFGYSVEKVVCRDEDDEWCEECSVEYGACSTVPFFISRSCGNIHQKHNLTRQDIEDICKNLVDNVKFPDPTNGGNEERKDLEITWQNLKSISLKYLKEMDEYDYDKISVYENDQMAYLTYRYVLANFSDTCVYAHIHYS